jgi:hypothetical protein
MLDQDGVCPTCHKALPADSTFCSYCGERLPSELEAKLSGAPTPSRPSDATAGPSEPQQTREESDDGRARGWGQISKKGLVAAVIIGLLAVLGIRSEAGELVATAVLPGAIALAVRSLLSGMTLGRGVFAFVGGYVVGYGLLMGALAGSGEDLYESVGAGGLFMLVFLAGLCLWTGFQKGKIWRRKK